MSRPDSATHPASIADEAVGKAAPRVRALVLAASRGPDDPLAKAFGLPHKCLLEVAGEPMLRRVVRALACAPEIADIAIVIDDEKAARQALGPELAARARFLPPKDSASASTLAALEDLWREQPDMPVLVTTGDHALLSPEMIREMVRAAMREPEADLLVGLAAREKVRRAFPEVKRTWLKFGPDAVTSCNLFLFRSAQALNAARFWQQVERNRKKPWRIARAFGLWPLIRLLLGWATLGQAFELASARLGVRAVPVLLSLPEAAVDVDKPEDLALAERIAARLNARPED